MASNVKYLPCNGQYELCSHGCMRIHITKDIKLTNVLSYNVRYLSFVVIFYSKKMSYIFLHNGRILFYFFTFFILKSIISNSGQM